MHRTGSRSVGLVFCALTVSAANSADLCKTAIVGTKCLMVLSSRAGAQLEPGQHIPSGSSMLLNPEYYGLPPVEGYWRYYRIQNQVYRVTPGTLKVIEIVRGGNALAH